jgi:hypothetical protein
MTNFNSQLADAACQCSAAAGIVAGEQAFGWSKRRLTVMKQSFHARPSLVFGVLTVVQVRDRFEPRFDESGFWRTRFDEM